MSVSPPPELRCKPFVNFGSAGDMTRPRLFLYTDGDGTNAKVNVGLRVSAESLDDLLTIGVDLVIPPRMHGVLDRLLKLVGR